MKLGSRLTVYLVLLHLVFMILAVAVLWERYRPWIAVIEALLLATLIVGFWLVRQQARVDELTEIGGEFIREGDFSHYFAESRQPEINQLVRIFNKMVETLRKERLLKLEQQKLLEDVIHSSPSGIMTLDLDGRIDTINPAAASLLGVETEAAAGRTLGEVSGTLASHLATLPDGGATIVSLPGPRKIRCEHGGFFEHGFRRSLFLMTDLTRELWRTEKRVYERVIRTFSHEVNNTVGAINSILRSCLAYSGQLSETDRPDYEEALNVAIDRSSNLNQFMSGYASIIRLPTPVRSPISLPELLRKLKILLEPECNQRKILLELDVRDQVPLVLMDYAQTEQALLNVVRNSIDAIGEGGRIRLQLREYPGGAQEVVVEDNGSGLKPEIRNDLFTPFVTSKENGQGLGLVLVKEVMTRHGLDFSLMTGSEGLTRFTFRIDPSERIDIEVNEKQDL
ncbi:MAG: ATP-binding protein [bacterium]